MLGYKEIEFLRECRCMMSAFQGDVDIDIAFFADNPAPRALYYVCAAHTVIDELYTEERLPKGHDTVAYLFGRCGRSELQNKAGWTISYSWRGCQEAPLKTAYFNGEHFQSIDRETAERLVDEYKKQSGASYAV